MKEIENLDVRPFTRFCMSIGAVPSSYLAGLSIEEQLLWLCSYLENEVIPAVNNNAEAVEELQGLFIQLQTYVDNYFDNLDVQEEINNKLDDMADSGELEEIIAAYLNTNALLCFDTVADMKSSENLIDGSFAKTLGFYSIKDGGESIYKIREITNQDIVNEMNIISLNNENLIAELIIKNNTVNVQQLGAKGDGESDDSDFIQQAINLFHVGTDTANQNYENDLIAEYPTLGGTVVFNPNTYIISKTINVPCYVSLDFNFATISAGSGTYTSNYMFLFNSTNGTNWIYAYPSQRRFIKNARIEGNNIEDIKAFCLCDTHEIDNIEFLGLSNAITNPAYPIYIDKIVYKNIHIRNVTSDNYQIDSRCGGENRIIENIDFGVFKTYGGTDPINGIYISSSHGCNITNVINGSIYVQSSDLVVIKNWHCEYGNLTIFGNTKFRLTDSEIYVRDNTIIPILLKLGNDKNEANNNSNPGIIENTRFLYYKNISEYNFDTYEINIKDWAEELFLNNVYRQFETSNRSQVSCTGIMLYDGTNMIPCIYNNNEIYARKVVKTHNNLFTTAANILNNPSAASTITWNLSTGTYYYKAVNVGDDTRLIGATSNEKSISVSDLTKGVSISIANDLGNGNILRLYRGTSAGSYTAYVDIPNPKSSILYDNGYSVNGFKWITMAAGAVPTYTSLKSINYEYENIVGYGLSYPGSSSTGSWLQGDRIYRLNPGTGLDIGKVCTTAGTPGTWTSLGSL